MDINYSKYEKYKLKKRSGEFETFTYSKLENMAKFLTRKTNCDFQKLINSVLPSIHDKMETDMLHAQMTNAAIGRISFEEPQWRLVAGKSKMVEDIKHKNEMIQKNFNVNRAEYQVDKCKFTDFLQLMGEKYDRSWFAYFEPEWLNKIAKDTIVFERNFEAFIESVLQVEKKFLIDYETPQHMYFVISLIYAQTYFNVRKMSLRMHRKAFEEKVKLYYDLFSTKKISAPSVILSELRKPNSNLASCFIGQFEDNLPDIMDLIKDFAMISKNGGK